jgi:para-nitrobenzyl esterase
MLRRSLLRSSVSFGVAALLLGFEAKEISAAEDSTIETTHGRVRGRTEGGVHVFRGIPYGGQASGQRRFMAPARAESWSGVRECTAIGPRAMQSDMWPHHKELDRYGYGGRQGELDVQHEVDSENCLVLNVLTPRGSAGKRPVMVYLHGGAFLTGSGVIASGAYGLVREQDVVLVSVNHRLNVFGYLYLGALSEKYSDSGTAGMLDLVLALQWVRDNIANFGGDPANVTIFGESGGGWKVSTLLAMPAARGLFHRAIVESGSATYALPADEATQHAEILLRKLNIGTRELDKLQQLSARKLLDASRAAGLLAPEALWPVVDGRNLTRHPFNPDAPATAAGVSMLIGYCTDEDRIFSGIEDPSVFHLDETHLSARLSREVDLPADRLGELITLYRRNYPHDTPSDIFFRITSDWDFGVNSTLQAERKAAQGDAVYKYLFAYAPPIEGRKFGAFHTAELPLVMRRVVYPESESLSRQLAGAWAAFARTGDPSQPGLMWPRYCLDRHETMILNVESRLANDPQGEIRSAWEKLPPPRFPQAQG